MKSKLAIAEQWLEEGSSALDKGDFEKAYNLLKAAVEGGCIDALSNLAFLYSEGKGVRKSRKRAMLLNQRAYRLGNAGAAYNIAVDYRQGRNRPLAIKWFRRAMDAGDGDAAVELAKLFLRPGRRSKKQVTSYLKKALRFKPGLQITEAAYEEAKRMYTRIEQKEV